MTDDAILVAIPVVARFNSDACSPGRPVPLEVRLPGPLGERTLYDAGTLPIRPVRTP